jgi:hypothetical protein
MGSLWLALLTGFTLLFLACGNGAETATGPTTGTVQAAAPIPTPDPTPPRTVYEQSRQLFDYDLRTPLDIQELSVEREGDITVRDMSYASIEGGEVPAYLVSPDGPGPFAGLILQHGMPGDRHDLLPHAKSLARTGAVVLVIDAPFNRRRNAKLAEPITTMTKQDWIEQVQLIVDLRRGVDLLSSRADVDPDKIGYIGFSYGAAMGGLLAGVETRINSYVLAVGLGGIIEGLCDASHDPSACRFPSQAMIANYVVLAKQEASKGMHYLLRVSQDLPNFLLGFQDGSLVKVESEEPISSGEFHHIGAVYDGASVSIYVDGVLTASEPKTGAMRAGSQRLCIGGTDACGASIPQLHSPFLGMIDEVEIYDRGLSAAEVMALARSDGAGAAQHPSSGAVSRWPADGDADDTLVSNPGTLRNGAAFADGKVGQAFSFDGVDDYVEIPHSTNIAPSAQITVSAWVRLDPLASVAGWLEAMEQIEPIRFVGQAAPASLFFQGALHDEFIREEDAIRFQRAGSLPKRVKWYEAGHFLNDGALRDQVEWLRSQIGIEASRFEPPR